MITCVVLDSISDLCEAMGQLYRETGWEVMAGKMAAFVQFGYQWESVRRSEVGNG